MSVDTGIIGLAKSGKTTLFNGLTGGKPDTAAYIQKSPTLHLGTAKVPDPRLQMLADLLQPKKVVPAEARFIDVGASVKDLVKEKAVNAQLLAQLSNTDAIIHVVRAFTDESIPHLAGNLDIDRDIATMDLELAFHDLSVIEKRLERIDISLKGAKEPERQNLAREKELLARIKTGLEADIPIRAMGLTADESKNINQHQFLTAKPLLIVVNIGEDQLPQAASLEAELNLRYSKPECRVLTLCGKLEMELGQLDAEAANEFRNEFGITEPGLERTIRLSYELLGLISFFSIASGEVKAWSIKKGTNALNAAGKIHTDIARGFIRAEVISHGDLMKCGSLAEARKKGLLRLEGKNYVVQDGDVITFLFNV